MKSRSVTVVHCTSCGAPVGVEVDLTITAIDRKGNRSMPAVGSPSPKKDRYCACGHPASFHAAADIDGHAKGSCLHGIGSAHGGCGCTKFHSRRQKSQPDPSTSNGHGSIRLGRCERLILTALYQEAQAVTRTRLALMTGYSHKSGGFANALGQLRSLDLVDDVPGGRLLRSDAGAQIAIDDKPLPTGKALVSHWQGKVGKCESEILGALLEMPGFDGHHKDRIAASTPSQYSPTSGGFANALGHLRSLGLVVGFALNAEIFG